jgi:exosortase/archaeosortase family protein
MAKAKNRKEVQKLKKEKEAKKLAYKQFLKQFIPLVATVVLWLVTINLLHIPSIADNVQLFFVNFVLDSSVLFGKILFLPVESNTFPYITVSGYTMKVIMECTAYNFYIFVIYLSLLSPGSWKKRIVSLVIFLATIFVINNMRFIIMGYIGKYKPELFHSVHDYLWNILFGFLVFFIWMWRNNPDIEKHEEKGLKAES